MCKMPPELEYFFSLSLTQDIKGNIDVFDTYVGSHKLEFQKKKYSIQHCFDRKRSGSKYSLGRIAYIDTKRD
jgi:hypothetical protein